MTKPEFTDCFDELIASYPLAHLDHKADVMRVYFRTLRGFDVHVMRKAITEASSTSPVHFPALGALQACCIAAKTEIDNQHRLPVPKYQPHDHEGCLSVGKQQIAHARRLLYQLAPYEGFHVLCPGPMVPRCPWCGIDLAPFVNPVIETLMRLFPYQTRQWNPQHKGNALCQMCATRSYPKDFILQRH